MYKHQFQALPVNSYKYIGFETSIFQVTLVNYSEGPILCSSTKNFSHMLTPEKFLNNGTFCSKENVPVNCVRNYLEVQQLKTTTFLIWSRIVQIGNLDRAHKGCVDSALGVRDLSAEDLKLEGARKAGGWTPLGLPCQAPGLS